MKFSKKEQEFRDYLDAIVEAELDLETSAHMKKVDWKKLTKEFALTRKLRKDFFEWFKGKKR